MISVGNNNIATPELADEIWEQEDVDEKKSDVAWNTRTSMIRQVLHKPSG